MITAEDILYLKESGCFDENWYSKKYLDNKNKSEKCPIKDYLANWKSLDRNPNPFFINSHYISQFENFSNLENPLIHYCTVGWKKFKNPCPGFNTWWYMIKHMPIEENSNPLAHFLASKDLNRKTCVNEGESLSVNEKIQYNKKSIEKFESLKPDSELASHIARANDDLFQFDLADMFAVKACDAAPDQIEPKIQLAQILMKRSNGWLRLIKITESILSVKEIKEVHYIRARALHKLHRYPEAVTCYKKAISNETNSNPKWLYYLAYCLEEIGEKNKAKKYYTASLANTYDIDNSLGIGILHESEQLWQKAEIEYFKEIKLGTKNPDIFIRHGLMLDYRYEWRKARHSYLNALKIDNKNTAALFRTGVTLEQQKKYEEAASYYAKANVLSKHKNNDWVYREGFALWHSKKPKEACEAWSKYRIDNKQETKHRAVFKNPNHEIQSNLQSPKNLYYIGRNLLEQSDIQNAIKAFKEVTLRSNNHPEHAYYYLGISYAKIERYEDACKAFSLIRITNRAYTIPEETIKPDKKQLYAEFIDTLSINKNYILYESFQGASISCNPLAMFRYISGKKEHYDKIHIWVINSEEDIPGELRNLFNVIFVKHGSDLYIRYLATAGYLINNNTFPPYFVRREEQKYLNTWHGTPLKTLGVDIPNKPFDHKNVVRNLLQCTHIVYPNKYTIDKFLSSYQAKDIYTAKTAFTGYPRIDLMLNASKETKQNIKNKLGITNNHPNIMFAPTWRGELSAPQDNIDKIIEAIEKIYADQVNIIISAHHLINEKIKNIQSKAIILNNRVDTTEALSIIDLLVTDYSSIMFDFLPQKKPIILYAYDIDIYSAQRGLYFDIDKLPFHKAQTSEELAQHIQMLLKNKSVTNNYITNDFLQNLIEKEDGNAAQRAAEFFFHDIGKDCKDNKTKKPKILFYTGTFQPNGIAASFLRMATALSKNNYSISLAVEPWLMESYPQKMQRFSELPEEINVLGRVSHAVATQDDINIIKLFKHPQEIDNTEIKNKFKKYYEREFSRLYGKNTFDIVVDFSGYSHFWTALFSLGNTTSSKAVWLHAHMLNEANNKFPYLHRTFSLYSYFDKIISVSEDINQTNKKHLSSKHSIEEQKFTFVRNLIDPIYIKNKALEPHDLQIDEWRKGHILFGSIGRLSNEKGYDRLIYAFNEATQSHNNIKLVIAGQGPEKEHLINLIKELNLTDKVKLLGYMENPYPLFKKLDAFILSSRYEGQGIVVLEALALDRPVISTNIEGPRELLKVLGGILVESSCKGLTTGIINFINNQQRPAQQNIYQYLSLAEQELHKILRVLYKA